MTRLFLCEKPSQGRDIGRVVGAGKDGGGCLVGDGVIVTWCVGHLLEMAPPEAYGAVFKTWDLETLPILPERWLLEVKDRARGQFRRVQELLGQATEVVIATDADREGEVIAREILERCRWRGPARRLWLSALDPASVRKALAQLQPGERTEPLYQAGLGRARADWLVGMNLTRAYTVLGRQGGHDGVLSVGRVQTPTLALVVARDREIEAFKPAAYYDLLAQIVVQGGRFRARWRPAGAGLDERGRCLDRAKAQAALARVGGAAGRITLAQEARKAEPPPLPFSLSALQQEASRRWGMPVKAVLAAAQALYETHKATTYPRSDCAYLPVSQHAEAPAVLAALARSDVAIAAAVASAAASLKSAAWNDAKVTAHHAIIPTAATVDLTRMNADERRIYELVRGRYLAQFYPDYEYLQTDVEAEIGGEVFVARARQPVVAGWRAVLDPAEAEGREGGGDGSGEDENGQALPRMRAGEACRCAEAALREGRTEPPKRYTEGTLIAAMKAVGKNVQDPALRKVLRETSGIGTEATRAGILETLFQRGYIERKGRKEIISTATGRALIDQVAPELRDPVITAVWEQGLDEIAAGTRALHAFLAQQADWVRQQVMRVQRGEAAWTAPAGAAEAHPCPACGQPLRRRKGSRGMFWGCSGYPDCRQTLPDVRGKPGKGMAEKSPQGPAGAGNGGALCLRRGDPGVAQGVAMPELPGHRLAGDGREDAHGAPGAALAGRGFGRAGRAQEPGRQAVFGHGAHRGRQGQAGVRRCGMTRWDQDMEREDKVIGLLFRLRWIEHKVRSARHDADGCEIEAWVGLPGESLCQGTVFRAATLSRCIDLGMAATSGPGGQPSWSRDPAFRPEWAAAGLPFEVWCDVYHDPLWAEYHETGAYYDTEWEVWLERAYERKGGPNHETR